MNKRPVVRYICTITCRADDQVYDVVADLDNREIMIQVFQHIKKSLLCKHMVLTPSEKKRGILYTQVSSLLKLC